MAESMSGLIRSHRCTEVSRDQAGELVTLMGWVQKKRNLGSLIFVDLRDRSGIIQLLFDEGNVGAEGYAKAASLRSEYVIAVRGLVQIREGAFNSDLKTGDIEIKVEEINILNKSVTPPFTIEDVSDGGDDLRMKYRYLDLRRNPLRNALMLRHRLAHEVRNYLDSKNFMEIDRKSVV